MAELIDIYNSALKTLSALARVLNSVDRVNAMQDPELEEFICDAVIKRFEFSYEAFWKFLKKILEITYELDSVNSPRSVFKAYVKLELCSEEEGQLLINMADSRNVTTHEYDEESVAEICVNVAQYYDCMIKIVERVKQDLEERKQ